MNTHDAKRILTDYRPGRSENSREVTEALALVERDPELNEWFSGQQRFHANVKKSLRTIEVPADLKTRILSGKKVVPLWRKTIPLYAAAAAAIILIGVATMWFQRSDEQITFAGYQDRMVGFALREYRMDVLSEDPQVIRNFLRKQGAPADFQLPRGLAQLPVMGGARLSWQGAPVSMVCYKLKDKEIAYLFVTEETASKTEAALSAVPTFGTTKGLQTATWKQGANVFFLAAPLGPEEMRALVQDQAASL